MTRSLLLDGDITAYQFAAMAEVPIHWGEDFWTLHADAAPTKVQMEEHIAGLMGELEADRLIVALSDSHNWRKDVLPSYKENRKPQRKPMILNELKDHMREVYEVFERPSLEGDDVLGILATHPKFVQGERIIISIDKDLRTIPGKVLNLKNAREAIRAKQARNLEECIEVVTLAEADRFHLMQALAGDPTDGYTGCPGIGMETAAKLIDDPHTLVEETYVPKSGKDKGVEKTRWVRGEDCTPWECVVSYYAKAGFGEEEALTQARVARILRRKDYDFKAKTPILWTP